MENNIQVQGSQMQLIIDVLFRRFGGDTKEDKEKMPEISDEFLSF